jgi:hypothetical protein
MKKPNWNEPRFSMKQAVIVMIAAIVGAVMLTILDHVL